MAKVKSLVKPQAKKQVLSKPLSKNKKATKPALVLKEEKVIKNKLKKLKAVKSNTKLNVPTIKNIENVASENKYDIPVKKVVKAVEIIFDMLKKRQEKGDDVMNNLLDEEVPIKLQITCIKIPKCPLRTVRFAIPHSLYDDTTEICLIVPDIKRGRKIDPEPTQMHYQDLLMAAGIKNVTVLPFTQLKLEYSQFEAKRRLANLYDVFLVDGRICGHVFHVLGKIFVTARKQPTSVRLNEKDIKNEFTKALGKTSIILTPRGNTTSVKVGHNKMSAEDVAQNILATFKWLGSNYPGGFENIETLYVKAPTSTSIPIYASLKSRNEVKIPVVVHHKKNMYRNVSGELSTILGATVSFEPDGKIRVKKEKVEGLSDEDSSKQLKSKKLKRNNKQDIEQSKKVKINKDGGALVEEVGNEENSNDCLEDDNQNVTKSKIKTKRPNKKSDAKQLTNSKKNILQKVTKTKKMKKNLHKNFNKV